MSNKPKSFLLNDLPGELHSAAMAKARAEKLPLRSIMLATLVAYLDGDITLTPGKRRRRRGRRPGRSVHIREKGKRGEVVVQPHRFSASLQRPEKPKPAPQPESAPAPASAPEPVPVSRDRLRTALAKLREHV
jgi:hypothetical protein